VGPHDLQDLLVRDHIVEAIGAQQNQIAGLKADGLVARIRGACSV
jgi:hypothetical protein